MYTELEICHCGFPKENHQFRHMFQGFTIYKNDSENYYSLNAEDFLTSENIVCERPNCKYSKNIHGTDIVNHVFIPKLINSREINFTVPEDTICCKENCKLSLNEHANNFTHLFCVKLQIVNKNENDVVKVQHPTDEEIKIDTIFSS